MAVTRASQRRNAMAAAKSDGLLNADRLEDGVLPHAREDSSQAVHICGITLYRGDGAALALLALLYTLQGVPMGLASSVTFLLQEQGASYAAQGTWLYQGGVPPRLACLAATHIAALSNTPYSLA
jgi:hypothetical protein